MWEAVASVSTHLARLAATYQGALPLTAAHYPTRDHWLPARWFAVFAAEVDAVESGHQLRQANAAAHGRLLTEGGSRGEVERLTRRIHRRAFPQVYRRRRAPAGG